MKTAGCICTSPNLNFDTTDASVVMNITIVTMIMTLTKAMMTAMMTKVMMLIMEMMIMTMIVFLKFFSQLKKKTPEIFGRYQFADTEGGRPYYQVSLYNMS